jgi:hypothetical protein
MYLRKYSSFVNLKTIESMFKSTVTIHYNQHIDFTISVSCVFLVIKSSYLTMNNNT